MHIDTYGHGANTSVVLLHGWAMHGGLFKTLAERLARHANVHVVDLPGHGLSEEREGLDIASHGETAYHGRICCRRRSGSDGRSADWWRCAPP